jgi:hypothetical protein
LRVRQLEQEAFRPTSQQREAGGATVGGDALGSDDAADLPIKSDGTVETEEVRGPLPAPESGEFGQIQPPEGEIWLRIPVEYSDGPAQLVSRIPHKGEPMVRY